MTRRPLILMLFLFAGVVAWALAEPTVAELEQNRRKLEAWRAHPEQLERLRRDLRAFMDLAAEQRDRIVRLDEGIHKEPAPTQARFEHVLKRYSDWLDRLPEKDRKAIQQAPDNAARLALIRSLRDEVWMSSRPKAQRDAWEKLQGDARADFVKRLRLEARQHHLDWLLASRFWHELESKQPMPCRVGDFSERVQKYVNEYLMWSLTDEEKQKLAAAEGRWPDYPQVLMEIAGRHPSALPPPDKALPRHLDQLPLPIRQKVSVEKKGGGKKSLLPKLAQFDNSPNFASKAVEVATKEGKFPFEFEFWACNYKSLQPPMANFVEKKLMPILDTKEKQTLAGSEGTWPFYPQTIQELSRKHNLTPPWHILPEPNKYKWDAYRPKENSKP